MDEKRLNEQIIAVQSAVLIAVALAGYMASDSIIESFNAIKDPNSYATIRTPNGIMTEHTDIDLTTCEAIVSNFRFICLTSIAIAVTIGTTNIIRILKRNTDA